MAKIQDRPLTGFELDCIVISQERLRKEPKYLELLEQRKELQELVRAGNQVFMREVAEVEYQIGYWDGKFFADVVNENPEGQKIQEVCLDLNERIKNGEFDK